MAKVVTSKKPNAARNVSHALNRTNRLQKLNKQYVTINGVRFITTAREARTLRKLTKNGKKAA